MKTSPIRDLGAFSQVDPRCSLRVCFGRQRKLWIETLLIVIVAILWNGYYRFYKRNYVNSNYRVPNYIFQNGLIHMPKIKLAFGPIVVHLIGKNNLPFIVDSNTLLLGGSTMKTRSLILSHSHSPISYHETIADFAKQVIRGFKNRFYYTITAHKCNITVKVKITFKGNT